MSWHDRKYHNHILNYSCILSDSRKVLVNRKLHSIKRCYFQCDSLIKLISNDIVTTFFDQILNPLVLKLRMLQQVHDPQLLKAQITSLTSVNSTVYSGADQRKHLSSASLAFVWGKSPGTDEFPAQMASNAGNVSIWCRHHDTPTTHLINWADVYKIQGGWYMITATMLLTICVVYLLLCCYNKSQMTTGGSDNGTPSQL